MLTLDTLSPKSANNPLKKKDFIRLGLHFTHHNYFFYIIVFTLDLGYILRTIIIFFILLCYLKYIQIIIIMIHDHVNQYNL